MEKGILFNTEMVNAILDGRKTQTRRVIKIDDAPENWKISNAPGDILWVRETWRDRWGMAYANYGTGNAYPIDDVREIEYKAGGNGFFMHGCNLCPDEPTVKWGEWSKWKPSIHMPKSAARIWLKVTDVRVERLQDITEEDAIKEGCKAYGQNNCSGTSARIAFAELWDSLLPPNKNKFKCPENEWRVNPWVWVIEFERTGGKQYK